MTKELKKSNTQDNNEIDGNDDIDFARYFNLLFEKKHLIISVTALFAVMGIVFALIATPIYKADALIQIEEKSSGVPGLGDLGSVLGSEKGSTAIELALLKSRKVIGYAVDKLKLDTVATPLYFPQVGKAIARLHSGKAFNLPWYASLLGQHYSWGGEKINVAQFTVSPEYLGRDLILISNGNKKFNVYADDIKLFSGELNKIAQNSDQSIQLLVTDLVAMPGKAFIISKQYREDVIALLKGSIKSAEQGKGTGVLSLTLEGEHPKQIKNIINVLSQGFLLQNAQRQSVAVEKSIVFLNSELPKIDGKQTVAEDQLNQYRLANDSVDLTMETTSVLEQLVAMDTELHELSFLEVDISQRYTKQHPKYLALITKQKDLQKQKNNLNNKIKALPKTQQKILRMVRDVEVNQQIYLALLNKVQELNVVKASTVSNIRIIDTAVVGRFPIKPKKLLIVVIITLLGCFLVIVFIIVKAAFKRGVTNPQDFEDVGLTVYATIPLSEEHLQRTLKSKLREKLKRNKQSKQEELLAEINPSDLAIEAMRSLRTSLHFAMLEAKNNIVMISGASPAVGKSFISSNLATVIAQAGQKVLLIDADLRKGYLHKLFNTPPENGLSDLLIGDVNFSQSIKKSGVENLDVLVRGKIPPNPSELLMSNGFTKLIEHAQQQYDLVIIDTPPILAVTDAAIIGKQVGTAFMLARYDVNPLKEIITAANRFDLNGVEIKGLIFNAVEKRASEHDCYNYEYK
ncbi:MAG: polysaccharide biosynthesis tyrosine autokinase [Colwellia sp.]|nr:polysaccharide biosynthesis tyrosine autokinase [Colwellia sp.]